MQNSRYGKTRIIDEYLIYPFNGPIGYDYNYSGTFSKFSLVDKFYTDSLVKTSKRLISGGAEWSNGLTFSLSDIYYSFSGEILSYSASYPGLSLSSGDTSYPRIDSIVITEDGSILVREGQPSLDPVKTPLNEDEILIQYAYIPASATIIGTKTPVYLTNTQWQSSSYLISGTYSGTFSLTSTSTPFDGFGDFCVDVTSDYRTGIRFTKPVGTLNASDYGSLTLRVRFSDEVPSNRSLVAQIQGTSSQFTGTASSSVLNLMSYGVDRTLINQWQHIVVPISKFGNVVTNIKNISFRLNGGDRNSNVNWKLDNIYFQTGFPYDEYMGEPDLSYNVGSSGFGATGSSGTSGTSGSGTSGTSGLNGSSGTSGSSGSSGTSGTGFNTILQPSDFRILTATGSSSNQAVAQSNLTFDGDTLTIIGNLNITGTSSIVNSQNLYVQDPIILLAGTQSGTPILDSGFMINRGTGATQAFIWDESSDEFAIIQTNDNSNIIGNINISSYANLQTGLLKSTGATFGQIKITSGAATGYVLVSDSTGLASWTSSTLNGVTGSGVTNYVPYWQSSTSLSSTSSLYISNGNVGIGITQSSYRLHVDGDASVDSLFIGSTQSSYSSKGIIVNVGTTNIHSTATASYSSSFYDYYIKNGNNLRAGTIIAVWSGSNIQFTEVSTLDIGDTTTGINAFTFSVVLSSPNAILQGISSLSNWEVKTMVRNI